MKTFAAIPEPDTTLKILLAVKIRRNAVGLV